MRLLRIVDGCLHRPVQKSGQELSMMVIAGVEDVFVPIPFDRILVHVNDAEQFALLDMLLSKLYICDVLNFPTTS